MLVLVRWLLLAASVLVGVALSSSPAHADPLSKPKSAAAREHLAQGNKLYNLRSFALAVDQYKAGAMLESAPVFDYNLGQSFRKLGKYEEAIWHYERFLKRGQPEGKLLDLVTNFIEQMKAELNRKAMTEQPDDPEPRDGQPPASNPTTQQPPSTPTTPAQPIAPQPAPWYADGIGWGLGGAGLLAGGAAVWLFVSASDLDKKAELEMQESRAEALRDRASSRRLFGTFVGIGGGALLVGGVVKLVLRPKSERPSATSWNLGVSSAGIVVVGRF